MKYSLNISQAFIIKCIMILFLLNPINTIDAKIESYSTEEVSIKNIKKNTLFKKFKPRKNKRKWNDLTYGEKSFRMSLWVLLSLVLSPFTAGIGFLALIICSIISIRLGLRSLKAKEEGISQKKRNQGFTISILCLFLFIAAFGILFYLFISLL